MLKQIGIVVAGVVIGLIVYEFGKKALGLDSYEENYEAIN
jgi:hypothetical protein